MKKNMTSALKGVAVGVALGTATYMVTNTMTKGKTKTIKKNAGKAIKAVGTVIDNVAYMMK